MFILIISQLPSSIFRPRMPLTSTDVRGRWQNLTLADRRHIAPAPSWLPPVGPFFSVLPHNGGRFRQLPQTSADVRDMIGERIEDGRFRGGVVGGGGEETKCIKRQKLGRRARNPSGSFRQRPRASVESRGMCGRKTEAGGVRRKQYPNPLLVPAG